MRWRFLVAIAAVSIAACETRDDSEFASVADAAPNDPSARAMTATAYEDGIACPGGCDAHVVFHPDLNGTANAYAPPMASRRSPDKCVSGEACVICFDMAGSSCMTLRYRGSGPPRGRFDFTPALLELYCGLAETPEALARQCAAIAATSRRYQGRRNCIADKASAECAAMMAAAEVDRARDGVERAHCLALGGDRAYNAQQADETLHRTFGCNYFLNRKGRNSSGDSWFKLAPGACRAGTYVGRDGLDCCSLSLVAAAAFDPECRGYFIEPG